MAAVHLDPADMERLGPAYRAQVEAALPPRRSVRRSQPSLRRPRTDGEVAEVALPASKPTPAVLVRRGVVERVAEPLRVRLVGWSWSRALWVAAAVLAAFGLGVALGVYGTLRAAPWEPSTLGNVWAATGHPAGAGAAGAGLFAAWRAARWAERILRWAVLAGAGVLGAHLMLAGVRF